MIQGVVVDEELVPIEGVRITDDNSPQVAVTDSAGAFTLGPVESGEHVLTAEKAGYATETLRVEVFDEPVLAVRVILEATAKAVPFHESVLHVTFVNCASRNLIGGMPCTALPDYVLGTNVSSNERYYFQFVVPSPGLADMLVEMIWTEQTLASDMLFKIQTPPGQPFTGLATSYYRMEGGQPLRGWVLAGVDNDGDGPGEVFDAGPNNITYEGLTIWSSGNATIPYTSIYVNHRTDAWLTFFYNRAGDRDFTALPEE